MAKETLDERTHDVPAKQRCRGGIAPSRQGEGDGRTRCERGFLSRGGSDPGSSPASCISWPSRPSVSLPRCGHPRSRIQQLRKSMTKKCYGKRIAHRKRRRPRLWMTAPGRKRDSRPWIASVPDASAQNCRGAATPARGSPCLPLRGPGSHPEEHAGHQPAPRQPHGAPCPRVSCGLHR